MSSTNNGGDMFPNQPESHFQQSRNDNASGGVQAAEHYATAPGIIDPICRVLDRLGLGLPGTAARPISVFNLPLVLVSMYLRGIALLFKDFLILPVNVLLQVSESYNMPADPIKALSMKLPFTVPPIVLNLLEWILELILELLKKLLPFLGVKRE